jgi:hypothetical protein
LIAYIHFGEAILYLIFADNDCFFSNLDFMFDNSSCTD